MDRDWETSQERPGVDPQERRESATNQYLLFALDQAARLEGRGYRWRFLLVEYAFASFCLRRAKIAPAVQTVCMHPNREMGTILPRKVIVVVAIAELRFRPGEPCRCLHLPRGIGISITTGVSPAGEQLAASAVTDLEEIHAWYLKRWSTRCPSRPRRCTGWIFSSPGTAPTSRMLLHAV